MDYASAIERIYEHIENGHVDKAVMGCIRVARHLKDYLSAATFLREMYPTKKEVARAIYTTIRITSRKKRNNSSGKHR